MDILSALKSEAPKLQKRLDTINAAMKNHRRKEQRQSRQTRQETAHVCKRESQNSEGAKGALGEGESSEEECITAPFVPLKLTSVSDLSVV